MVQKYVWWDDIKRRDQARLELRVPVAMHEMLAELAKESGVSMNALGVGLLGYMLDQDRRKRLRIDVRSAVYVTDHSSGDKTIDVPVQNIKLGRRKT